MKCGRRSEVIANPSSLLTIPLGPGPLSIVKRQSEKLSHVMIEWERVFERESDFQKYPNYYD